MRIDQIFFSDPHYDELIRELYKSDLLGTSITDVHGLNRLLSQLIGDYMEDFYPTRLAERQIVRVDLPARLNQIHDEERQSNGDDEQWMKDLILRDLFLWTVLMNRIDMATVLLSHLKHRICAALIASQILKSYADLSSYTHIKEGYQQSADYFQNYAIQCLTLCFANDASKTCQIILRSNPLFAEQSCLRVNRFRTKEKIGLVLEFRSRSMRITNDSSVNRDQFKR